MFFTRVGMLIAWLACIVGAMQLAMSAGVILAPESFPDSARYLGTKTGAALDRGAMLLLVGIAFGILTDISRSLQRP